MTDHEAQGYLSAALDQEACKATLTAALKSRVSELEMRGFSGERILSCLYGLCDDPFQMHEDIIEDVIEWMHYGSLSLLCD